MNLDCSFLGVDVALAFAGSTQARDVADVVGGKRIDRFFPGSEAPVGEGLHAGNRTCELPLVAVLCDQVRLRDQLRKDLNDQFFLVCHGPKNLQVLCP